MNHEKLYALLILILGVSLLTFGAVQSHAQDKPAAKAAHVSPAPAPEVLPTLPDAQNIALLEAETKVLEDQIAVLQAQLVTAQKAAAFAESRNAFLRVYDDSFKAAGVTSEEFDLPLTTRKFARRNKTAPAK